MLEKLKKLHNNSYSPYSKFKVSSIVVMKDNQEFAGVNVENASYGATICAERNAITTAITKGYTKGDFKEIHIMVDSGKIGMPCFLCRQTMVEFFDNNSLVYVYDTKGNYKKFTLDDICPYPFTDGDLK